MNIKTHNASFEPALTQVDPNTGATGVFAPSPYLNSIGPGTGATVGLTPAGTFTGDLGVPISANSFQRAIPPFGGYPNTPGNNGGIAFGLAFLNDIQVFMFMEAAQGDRRVNVMQAPKLTLFNGQTATLAVTSTSFYVTNVSVISVNGQLVFSPTNTPLPGPDTNFNIGIQAVVSADRRFVRLNLPVNLAAQSGATVPLFPITTFITPVFEGGSQGIPIPFTQFLQQPSFTSLNIQTTVVCPDGGTVLLGGLKTLQEGRNEFGPPVLSKIPYLNRLFKNVGIGRETRHIMIMVTPRIIINAEEEIFQTEGRPQLGGQN
jgi:Flp pilus assembly secretin CpaC